LTINFILVKIKNKKNHFLKNLFFLGTGHQATNWKVVRDLKLTHIINISVEHPCVFSDKIKYLHLELEDKEDVLLKDRFDETIHFMETALQNPSNRILVHCNLGISRSTTLILAYLMRIFNATLYEVFKFLKHRRPIVCPNLGFLRQLIDYEYELFSYIYSDPNDPMFH
jgi:serine/threonine/tyrosine-interacting-like protein 1